MTALNGQQFGPLTVQHDVLHVGGEPYHMAMVEPQMPREAIDQKLNAVTEPSAHRLWHVPMENGAVLTGTAIDLDQPNPREYNHSQLMRTIDMTNRKAILGVPRVDDRPNQPLQSMGVVTKAQTFHDTVDRVRNLPSGSGTEEGWESVRFPWEKR